MKAIKLIEGTYSNKEAADILLSVLGDKIRFHEIKKLSLRERHGIDSIESGERLTELRAARQEIIDLFKNPENEDLQFSISSSINITVRELV
jgi:hypothetical protein